MAGSFSNRKSVRPEIATASISFRKRKQHDLMAALAQDFGHGRAGETNVRQSRRMR